MISYDYNPESLNNVGQTRDLIRLSPQTLELHRARINNLRISSMTDICMVSICIILLFIILYLYLKQIHMVFNN